MELMGVLGYELHGTVATLRELTGPQATLCHTGS